MSDVDTVTGTYTTTGSGTDLYTLWETGTVSGGAFAETLTGTDSYAIADSGNTDEATDTSTTTGGGSWTRTSSGPGATLPSDSGTNGYTLVSTGNALLGSFSESETGTDRYGLVQSFDNVANDASGNTPGNVTFHGEGLPFRDPSMEEEEGLGEDPKFNPAALESNLKKATFGAVYHHIDTVVISLPGKTDKELKAIVAQLAKDMAVFRDFNPNNLVDVKVVSPETGNGRYGGFSPPKGAAGLAAKQVTGDGPEGRSYVALGHKEDAMTGVYTITAATLGNHLLVGVRIWSVFIKDNKIVISTEAFENRSTLATDLGFNAPSEMPGQASKVKIKGVADTETVWRTYLKNIAESQTENQSVGTYKFPDDPLSEFPTVSILPGSGRKDVLYLHAGALSVEQMSKDIIAGKNPLIAFIRNTSYQWSK